MFISLKRILKPNNLYIELQEVCEHERRNLKWNDPFNLFPLYSCCNSYVQDLVGDKQDTLTVYDCLCHL